MFIFPFTSLSISGAGWDCGARNARMYFIDDFKNKRVGGWCAATSENQWLQVDLGTNRYITAVGTQGVQDRCLLYTFLYVSNFTF